MLFQSNLRKQIRKLPKILNFVKIIHSYSKFFTGVLRQRAERDVWPERSMRAVRGRAAERGRAGGVPPDAADAAVLAAAAARRPGSLRSEVNNSQY